MCEECFFYDSVLCDICESPSIYADGSLPEDTEDVVSLSADELPF